MKKLAETLPRQGDGDADVVAGQRIHYTWQRDPVALKFDRGRIVVTVPVTARLNLFGERVIPIAITIAGEPVVTADFKALLQSTDVQVVASGAVDAVNHGIEAKLQGLISRTLEDFRFDLRPMLANAFGRIARPIEFAVGDQTACAELHIAALEAAPTVLADGFEKDLAVVVLPSVTLPCTPAASPAAPAGGAVANASGASAGTTVAASHPGPGGTMVNATASAPEAGHATAAAASYPLLANVASLPTGPFRVVIPVAARYEELSKALASSMGERLFFSRTYPELYLEKPEVYPSDDTIVIRMTLGGKAAVAGFPTTLSGELFFSGHPHVIDNQISVPDLDITPGTADELVKLKFALDYTSIRDQARQAMRVDISERLAAVKEKLSTELSFDEGNGCVRAQVLRSEVTGVYPHPSFLRIYTQVDAQTSLYLPCKK